MINAYAAFEPAGKLKPFSYDPGELGAGEVEIDVEYCGICHSDLSMLNNEWGMSSYPLVAGHEVSGRVSAVGAGVANLKTGDRVGLGWHAGYCGSCESCGDGDHNLCAHAHGTIVGRHGGFADKVRADARSVVALPEGVNPATAGPLFCGGITVFNPLIQFDVKPTDKVGVIGIGGLGHIALKFLNAWGCEVTAFTSTESKAAEARSMGAHHIINSTDAEALSTAAGTLDLILSTVNVKLDWNLYLATLRPKGRLHFVGASLDPIDVSVFGMIMGQRSISGSPVGSPATIAKMLDFAALHHIEPLVETFPMSQVNEALAHLQSGKARYRIVLQRD
jgi:uncharacterized zinc-type alcohol dehydrogenase-like protein